MRFLVFLLFLPACLAAESFTVETAVARALAHNPGLAAARLTLTEAQGRLDQAGLLANPDLTSEFKPNLQGQQGVFRVGVAQQFPLTSRLRLERSVSQRQLAAAHAEVRDAERRLAAEVSLAVVGAAALDARRALVQRQIEALRSWSEQLARSTAVGEVPGWERDQVTLEMGQLRLAQKRLEGDVVTALNRLRLLLALPDDVPLTIEEPLPPPGAGPPAEVILAQRGDYQSAQERTAAAEEATALARARRWEDLGVGIFGEWERRQDAPVGVVRDEYVGLQVSLPLPFWNRQEGRIREAKAAAQREVLATEALAAQIRSEAASSHQAMNAAAGLEAEISGELLPAALRLEEQLARFRAEGQEVFTPLQRAREKRFELEGAQMDALRDYHVARVRWQAATGQILLPTP